MKVCPKPLLSHSDTFQELDTFGAIGIDVGVVGAVEFVSPPVAQREVPAALRHIVAARLRNVSRVRDVIACKQKHRKYEGQSLQEVGPLSCKIVTELGRRLVSKF